MALFDRFVDDERRDEHLAELATREPEVHTRLVRLLAADADACRDKFLDATALHDARDDAIALLGRELRCLRRVVEDDETADAAGEHAFDDLAEAVEIDGAVLLQRHRQRSVRAGEPLFQTRDHAVPCSSARAGACPTRSSFRTLPSRMCTTRGMRCANAGL